MNVRQIAKQAGVSTSTVSLVLNNKPGVRQETRDRIAALLIENGYTIRAEAKESDGPEKLRTILFLRYCGFNCVMEPKDEFLIRMMVGAEQQAHKLGYQLQLSNADHTNLDDVLSSASNHAVGIVFFASELEESSLDKLKTCHIPLVIMDAVLSCSRLNAVTIDNMEAMEQAVQYLHSLGHTKIGYLHYGVRTGSIPERERGYYAAMREYGLPVSQSNIILLPPGTDAIYDQMCRVLSTRRPLPTAFVSDSDVLAMSSMRALQDHGYRIPQDISLIGFDDISFCTLCNPPMTTMHYPKEEVGIRAVKRIHEIIETGDTTAYQLRLYADLVVRNSSQKRE
ncbi:MAG: LacI family DNA-binding transcriptional regulator [Eubacteriales bacterium]|nr:LacI family DNA-binding transcriptional regulator [Eubacteriales bacterium]